MGYKAIFVARGFSQKKGIDYEDTFEPIVRYTSIRTVLALEAFMKWKIHQMDVKTTFLNDVFEKCMWNNHSDSRHMVGRPMCAN